MTYQPVALWHQFRDGFVARLRDAATEDVLAAWATQTTRTAWYRGTVLKALAGDLGLHLRAEFLNVDFSLWTDAQGGAPVVFVESENLAKTASDEVSKLCSVSAPLKVLLTCVEWGKHWGEKSQRGRLLADWQAVARSHHAVWPQEHLLGICVAEICESKLRVYAVALDGHGDLVEDVEYLLE